ncbi:hypothetical protein ASZ90_015919 [hydrocarbon metagenome]|uniref:Uncharacterized protein n=1 Tax=hydrocarbon metagenome TaxID=938273 RepID=A0A0W8F0S9_9ZZZZ
MSIAMKRSKKENGGYTWLSTSLFMKNEGENGGENYKEESECKN